MDLGIRGERVAYIFVAAICAFIIFLGFIATSAISIVVFYWTSNTFPYSENDLAERYYNLITTMMSLFIVEIAIAIVLLFLYCCQKYCAVIVILFVEMLLFISSLVLQCVYIHWTKNDGCDKIMEKGLEKAFKRPEYITWRDGQKTTDEKVWNNQCHNPKKTFLGFFIVEMVGIGLLALVGFPLAYRILKRMSE